jgi:DNA gyrase inhibitor GyrI
MDINIETLPPYYIAYIRQTGPYGEGNKLAMETLKSLSRSSDLLNDESIILGIARDDPANTMPEYCRYDACLVIADNTCRHGASLNYGAAPGGRYAVFTIDHTPEAVQRAWVEIFSELTKLGHQIDGTRPVIERYAAKIVKEHKCEICVPID